MELISQILLQLPDSSSEKVGKYLTGEGSWLGMTALAAMLAFVIYWVFWNIDAASKKKKEDEIQRNETGEWVFQNGEWVLKDEGDKIYDFDEIQYTLTPPNRDADDDPDGDS